MVLIAGEPGIGCYREYIAFTMPDNSTFVLDKEKDVATAILTQNRNLHPAMVLMASRLCPIVYAQCSFDGQYKEASAGENFLRHGRLVNYMRKHSVASLIAVSPELAEAVYALGEPRIEEMLYVVLAPEESPVRYESIRGQVVPHLHELPHLRPQRKTLWDRILQFFGL